MFFILLYRFLRVYIVLDDLFVCAAREENVLFVVTWMKLDTLWIFLVLIVPNDLARLGVPEIYAFVETCTQKFSAVICKTNVSDGLTMAHISPNTSSMSHHIPYFDVAIVTCTQKQMTSFRKESDALNAALMTHPGVDPLLGNEAIMFLVSKVRRRIDKTFACVLQ